MLAIVFNLEYAVAPSQSSSSLEHIMTCLTHPRDLGKRGYFHNFYSIMSLLRQVCLICMPLAIAEATREIDERIKVMKDLI